MKWLFPAKTFLIGEYLALQGGPAIVLTTTPYFEVSLTDTEGLYGIHPDSPAGKWWLNQHIQTHGLCWFDPYHGRGGLGASGAQFLGAYTASQYLRDGEGVHDVSPTILLRDFLTTTTQREETPPSGYDVLAQSLKKVALIHVEASIFSSVSWPFQDLAFILIRTGVKIATHQHLKTIDASKSFVELYHTASQAFQAWHDVDSSALVVSVQKYHQQLLARGLVAASTLRQIETLKARYHPLAIKGCGAMGADVMLLLLPSDVLDKTCHELREAQWEVLATTHELA